jgi:hypothetical protein
LDFPGGTTRRDLAFDHSIILSQLFGLLRGSHERSGFTKVIFPQALVVLGGDRSAERIPRVRSVRKAANLE